MGMVGHSPDTSGLLSSRPHQRGRRRCVVLTLEVPYPHLGALPLPVKPLASAGNPDHDALADLAEKFSRLEAQLESSLGSELEQVRQQVSSVTRIFHATLSLLH